MTPDVTPLLDRALRSPYGIAVRTADIEHLRRTIYHKRAELQKLGITIYDNLSFYTKPGNYEELFIIRKNPTDATSEQRHDPDSSLCTEE